MTKRELLLVLCAFALSIAVRIPLLDRPLSAHHEYCTAFTLVALTNWYDDGFQVHHGVPSGGFVKEGASTLPKELDRNERIYIGSMDPKAGACGSVFNIPQEKKLNHFVEIETGVMQAECSGIIRDFFKQLRKNKAEEKHQ